jgi:formyltetrahydrofolate synthetase
MDALLKHYENAKVKYSNPINPDKKSDVNDRMLRSIEMGWWVLDKYYQRTDKAPVYAAALLLDPQRRSAYLRRN